MLPNPEMKTESLMKFPNLELNYLTPLVGTWPLSPRHFHTTMEMAAWRSMAWNKMKSILKSHLSTHHPVTGLLPRWRSLARSQPHFEFDFWLFNIRDVLAILLQAPWVNGHNRSVINFPWRWHKTWWSSLIVSSMTELFCSNLSLSHRHFHPAKKKVAWRSLYKSKITFAHRSHLRTDHPLPGLWLWWRSWHLGQPQSAPDFLTFEY